MDRLACKICNSEKKIDITDMSEGKINFHCRKCNLSFSINEIQEEQLNNESFVFLPLKNAFYRKNNLVNDFFHKISIKKGQIQKRQSMIGKSSEDFEYVKSKLN